MDWLKGPAFWHITRAHTIFHAVVVLLYILFVVYVFATVGKINAYNTTTSNIDTILALIPSWWINVLHTYCIVLQYPSILVYVDHHVSAWLSG